MTLIPRLDQTDPDPERHIPIHEWSAAMWFLAKGEFTKAQLVEAYTITVSDEVQLDQLITHYLGLPVSEQQEYHSTVESAGILLEAGQITVATYKSLLGMT
jgi:hypothetical protein